MLKLPKGLKKKKKKSKKDKELFTEEELEQYKRELKAKQEAATGESDAASDAEGLASAAPVPQIVESSNTVSTADTSQKSTTNGSETAAKKSEEDEEWAKFKALTSGVDTILHKTQDELDRIKKESFYQRLPSAAEKKRLEEEEAARLEQERLEEEKRKAAEREAQRDKLAEAVVELSDSEEEFVEEGDDIFATDYIEAITSGEIQLAVVPESPVLEDFGGPDPFDTAYAEKVIVGADKAKGNKKLVSLGAAVEVLSGRVDREHALALAKPKRKLRKGIQNLLLSESVDYEEGEVEIVESTPQINLLDDLVDDVPETDAPIDLSVSLHLHLIKPKKQESEEEPESILPDLSEFDTLKEEEDDEFAELAVESLTKKEEVKVITEIPLPQAAVLTEIVEADWAEFEQTAEEKEQQSKVKPSRPPPPSRPATGPHIIPGAIFISDEEDNLDDDPFNTTYADQVIKKTTVLDEDDDFDPRAEEKSGPPPKPAPPAGHLLSDLSKAANTDEDFDPFDTSIVTGVIPQNKLKQSLSDPDFDPRAEDPVIKTQISTESTDFDTARRKSSLNLNLQQRSVGFLVPNQDLLSTLNDGSSSKKPLTPYYAPNTEIIAEKEAEDPFDTSYVPEARPSDIELKHLEKDLLEKTSLKHSLSDPDFDPRAPPTPILAEDLLTVKENINIKVLTPQESKDLVEEIPEVIDPFDTSIAANLQPGETELRLLENELLPESKTDNTKGVLDIQTDAQELGLGDKVLTPIVPRKEIKVAEDIDPFDTSIAENLAPGETEIKLLESELIN